MELLILMNQVELKEKAKEKLREMKEKGWRCPFCKSKMRERVVKIVANETRRVDKPYSQKIRYCPKCDLGFSVGSFLKIG